VSPEIEYVGHIDVAPVLNETEIRYLHDGSFRDESGRPCPWLPSNDGRRLMCEEGDLEPAQSLRYLIGQLLKPGASRSFRKELEGFSFDHHLDGMVVGVRDNGGLIAVTASRNRVRQRVLRSVETSYDEMDRTARRRVDGSPGGKVISLETYR
jgi:hypothetical protein